MDSSPLLCHFCNRKFVSVRTLNIHLKFIHTFTYLGPLETTSRGQKAQALKSQRCDQTCADLCNGTIKDQTPDAKNKGGTRHIVTSAVKCEDSPKKDRDQGKKRTLEYCGRSFHTRKGVKHSCDVCEKTFSKDSILRLHKKEVHLGIKKFCNICGQSFTRSNLLNDHVKNEHENVKPSNRKCEKCGKYFANTYNLKRHIYSVHESMKAKRKNESRLRSFYSEKELAIFERSLPRPRMEITKV